VVNRARLGINPLSRRLLLSQAACLGITAALFYLLGLSVEWRTAIPLVVADLTLFLLWFHLSRNPGSPREWLVAETVFVFLLMLTLSHILAPAQYAATALNRPLIDPILARADASLGFHVPALAEWLRPQATLNAILSQAYYTLLWQFAVIVPLLGLFLRDRLALWEYLFYFHFCAIVTLVALAIFPAACAFQYYGFESTLDQTRFISHFNGLREGSRTLVRFDDLEGLISMPSFHVAGGLMVTWAVRQRLWLLIPIAALNAMLIAATVLTGAHYVVDVIATVGMFGIGVLLYRKWGAGLVEPAVPGATRAARPGPALAS
jgi:hypothetical protein